MTFLTLALLPSILAMLACVVALPLLVALHVRRAESPVEAPSPPGWALALDEALEADAEADALDWTAPVPRVKAVRKVRRWARVSYLERDVTIRAKAPRHARCVPERARSRIHASRGPPPPGGRREGKDSDRIK